MQINKTLFQKTFVSLATITTIILLLSIFVSLSSNFKSFFKQNEELTRQLTELDEKVVFLQARLDEVAEDQGILNGELDAVDLYLEGMRSDIGGLKGQNDALWYGIKRASATTSSELEDMTSLILQGLVPTELPGQQWAGGEFSDEELVIDAAGAKKTAEERLAVNPNDVNALRVMGKISYEEGDLPAARDYYIRIKDLMPSDKDAVKTLGRIAYQLEEYELCIECFEGLVISDDDPLNYYNLASAYYRSANYVSARENIEVYLSENSESAAAYELDASIDCALGDFGAALSSLEAATLIEPMNSQYQRMGDISNNLGDRKQAVKYWEEGIVLSDVNALEDYRFIIDSYERIALCAYEMENYRKVKQVYAEVAKREENERIHFVYLKALRKKEDAKELKAALKDFEKTFPESKYNSELEEMSIWLKGV